ncbi:MAG: restriction endonuclease subunit S [Candidatus Sericytochromatia bacterium]
MKKYDLSTGFQQISDTELKNLDKQNQLELMKKWFLQNFEDPQENNPYDSESGDYIFIWGGPFNAIEVLLEEFEEYVDKSVIEELANQLEKISPVWSTVPSQVDNEESLAELVKKQILDLGYSKNSIYTNYKTYHNRVVDLVVIENDKPKIAIEIKKGLGFPNVQDSTSLRFHPAVRQAQRLSKEINSDYFAISNGEITIWFDTDQEGIPKILPGPILADGTALQPRRNKDFITRKLYHLIELINFTKNPFDSLLLFSLALYAQILKERGNGAFFKALIEGVDKSFQIKALEEKLKLNINILESKEYFRNAYFALEDVNFLELSSTEFWEIIDEFILLRIQSYAFKLPRWLSDFLVKLCRLEKRDNVLDIFSNFGDIASSIRFNGWNRLNVTSLTGHPISYLWAEIQALFDSDNFEFSKIILSEIPAAAKDLDFEKSARPNKIVVAPPFNLKFKSDIGYSKLSEDIYLELAMQSVSQGGRIVALLPEGFLFSTAKKRKDFRQYLISNMSIKAIFSLGALMPNSGIRTSVLVIDNVLPTKEQKIILGRINESDIHDLDSIPNDSNQIKAVSKLIGALSLEGKSTLKASNVWSIPLRELNADNFSVDNYAPKLRASHFNSVYPLVPLADFTQILKGSPLTLDEFGDLHVIGPAAVRQMEINELNIDRTNEFKLPRSPVVSKTGDILVNALGNYRGHAALVKKDFSGFFISRNIIVIRLTTNSILATYLEVALNSEFVINQVLNKTTGSVIQQVTKNSYLDVLIPLPPIEIQEKIVKSFNVARTEVSLAQEKIVELQLVLQNSQKKIEFLLKDLHVTGGIL